MLEKKYVSGVMTLLALRYPEVDKSWVVSRCLPVVKWW